MNANELDSAIDAYLENRLSESEVEQLSSLIEKSAEVRERYWEAALIHAFLEQSLQNASLKSVTSDDPVAFVASNPKRSFRWNPIASAVAGVMIGAFCATMVWAYKGPMANAEVREDVLFESFEGNEPMPLIARFPDRAGAWFGNLITAFSPEDGLDPERGKSVAKFTSAHPRKYSYAWHILDVEDLHATEVGQSTQLEVKASFASDQLSAPVRYQIRLAVFSQPPEEIRAIWNREAVLFETVLQHTARNYLAKPDEEGWKKLFSRIDIPPGARSIVISLGLAGQDGSWLSGAHYLDAVRARIIFNPAPLY